ncbi:MAG: hypothetical protein ACOVLG_05690 [Flavobacterium sp.]
MKKYLIILLLINVISIYSQNDIRGVKWGSTVDEVIKSEYPLIPKINKNEVKFENVNIGEKILSTLIYTFTNGKLSELRYIVYGSSQFSNGVGTCEYQVPLYYKYIFTKFIFDTLKSKDYQCSSVWRFEGGDLRNEKYFSEYGRLKDKSFGCNFDEDVLNKLDEIGQEIKSTKLSLGMENSRTFLNISFNNPLNSETFRDCNNKILTSDFFNTYFWLVFEPSYDVKRSVLKSNF